MFIETSSKKQLSQGDEVSSMSLGKSVFTQMFISIYTSIKKKQLQKIEKEVEMEYQKAYKQG